MSLSWTIIMWMIGDKLGMGLGYYICLIVFHVIYAVARLLTNDD